MGRSSAAPEHRGQRAAKRRGGAANARFLAATVVADLKTGGKGAGTAKRDKALANGLASVELNLDPHPLKTEVRHPKAGCAGGVIKSAA